MSDVVDLPDTPPTLFVLHSCILGFSVSYLCLISVFTFFIARQQRSMLMRDIDIAILYVRPSVRLSVRYVPVPDENGLIYRHTFSLYGR